MSGTGHDFEERVRERAYHLWRAEGGPDGRDTEFWHRARLLEAAEGASAAPDRPRDPLGERRVEADIEEAPAGNASPVEGVTDGPGDAAGQAGAGGGARGLSIFDALARTAGRGSRQV